MNDKKVREMIDFALLSVNEEEGYEVSHILTKLINATKQVNFFLIMF